MYVEGRLATRKYTDKEGVERQITEIKGDRVQFLDSKGGSGQGGQPQASGRQRQAPPQSQNTSYDPDDVPF